MCDVVIVYDFLWRQTHSQPMTDAVAKASVNLLVHDFTARQSIFFHSTRSSVLSVPNLYSSQLISILAL